MKLEEIETHLKLHFPDADVRVQGEACALQLTIVSDVFLNKSRLQRQKLVYTHLSAFITSGALHALSMKTFTQEEWKSFSIKSRNDG